MITDGESRDAFDCRHRGTSAKDRPAEIRTCCRNESKKSCAIALPLVGVVRSSPSETVYADSDVSRASIRSAEPGPSFSPLVFALSPRFRSVANSKRRLSIEYRRRDLLRLIKGSSSLFGRRVVGASLKFDVFTRYYRTHRPSTNGLSSKLRTYREPPRSGRPSKTLRDDLNSPDAESTCEYSYRMSVR